MKVKRREEEEVYFKGMWPQDSYGGSLLILPNVYVMLAL
jgi:hypothetical protein